MSRTDQRDSPGTTSVVVVEDESWMRQNLEREINRQPGLRCLGSYRSAELALAGIPNDKPDIVIMDINLPGMDGVECVKRLKAEMPGLHCLMLTVYEESERIFNSLLAGASGYLLKRTSTSQLMEAIQQVREGGSPMSSSIAPTRRPRTVGRPVLRQTTSSVSRSTASLACSARSSSKKVSTTAIDGVMTRG